MKDAPLEKKPKTLSFRKLPGEKQEKLRQLQQQKDENIFVFPEKLSVAYWLMTAFGLIWIGYLFYSSQNILWEPWVFWLNAGLTGLAVFGLVFGLAKILSFFFSKKSDGYIFTKDEFFRIRGDLVQIWNLKQLESLRVEEDQKQVETWIGDHEERFGYTDFAEAKRLEKLFDGWKLTAQDDFAEGCGDPKFAYSPAGKIIFVAGSAAIAVLLAGGLVFAAKTANANYDDDVVWNLAAKAGTVQDLEAYKTKYPAGRHLTEANQKISVILGQIKQDYAAFPKETADPSAVATLSAVLDQITQSADRRLFVRIRETRELDDAVIRELEAEYGLDVQSYEYTAPASNEEFRRGKILTDLKLMLRDIVKDGAVELVPADQLPAESPSIEVAYLIKSAKMYYTYDLFFQGKRTINFYPGLEFKFDFVLRSGASPDEYRDTFSVLPTKIKPAVFRQEDIGNYTFDKNLFSGASEDFARHLGRNLGLAAGAQE